MEVNKDAPVIAVGEIEIAADPATVWDVMTAIDYWPRWNPDIRWASLDGKLVEGSKFRWKSGPGTITSTIQRVEKPHFFAWSGIALGVRAIHIWILETKDKKTKVRTEESWEGFLARIFRGPLHKTLQKAIDTGLLCLKAESERKLL